MSATGLERAKTGKLPDAEWEYFPAHALIDPHQMPPAADRCACFRPDRLCDRRIYSRLECPLIP
jgi:hypothetical protein